MKSDQDIMILFSVACLKLKGFHDKNPDLSADKYIKKSKEILNDVSKKELLHMAALAVASATVFDNKTRKAFFDVAKKQDAYRRKEISKNAVDILNAKKVAEALKNRETWQKQANVIWAERGNGRLSKKRVAEIIEAESLRLDENFSHTVDTISRGLVKPV